MTLPIGSPSFYKLILSRDAIIFNGTRTYEDISASSDFVISTGAEVMKYLAALPAPGATETA